MSEPDLQTLVDGARAYEQIFVPALFGQWAEHIVSAAQISSGQKVLDVACGTGILAREAAKYTGLNGHVTGVDVNPGMLAVATECAPEIEWQEAVAERLPFPENQFDVVLSQFGLMFFQSRVKAISEMLRALKSSGRLTVAVWDAVENLAGFSTQLELIERLAGISAAEASRAPFALGNREDLTALFREAGATPIEAKTITGNARFPSVQTMVEVELRGWLPVMGVNLTEELIQEILDEAESALAPYTTDHGIVVFDVTAHILTTLKP